MKYYQLDAIKEKHALYNLIFGERSNGKTYAVIHEGLKMYFETGKRIAIVRRWADDVKSKFATKFFENHVNNGVIKKLSRGEYNGVRFRNGEFYFIRSDVEKGKGVELYSPEPFAYTFSLTATEHTKSSAYPYIGIILFDEFIATSTYIPNEFVLFMNTISTIVRDRNDIPVYMTGNTVNTYCPYFNEMGLTHISKMKPGDIDLYRYGDSNLTVAVEYTAPTAKGKKSDVYFAFDNPKLQMITGGSWAIDIYPHCPCRIKPKDVIMSYFIKFNNQTLQCDIISDGEKAFTYIHNKTTEIKDEDTDIIFSTETDARPNHFRKITKPTCKIVERIAEFFKKEKVFYQDNMVGDTVKNYLQWCIKG